MDDLELRKWAVEQAVQLHGQSGFTTKQLIQEAADLLAYVRPPPPVEKKEAT